MYIPFFPPYVYSALLTGAGGAFPLPFNEAGIGAGLGGACCEVERDELCLSIIMASAVGGGGAEHLNLA